MGPHVDALPEVAFLGASAIRYHSAPPYPHLSFSLFVADARG